MHFECSFFHIDGKEKAINENNFSSGIARYIFER